MKLIKKVISCGTIAEQRTGDSIFVECRAEGMPEIDRLPVGTQVELVALIKPEMIRPPDAEWLSISSTILPGDTHDVSVLSVNGKSIATVDSAGSWRTVGSANHCVGRSMQDTMNALEEYFADNSRCGFGWVESDGHGPQMARSNRVELDHQVEPGGCALRKLSVPRAGRRDRGRTV